jgi:hypothetical protein
MRVYKILPAKYAIEDLNCRRLKIARLDELNDPFELMCCELPTPATREAYRRYKADLALKCGVLCFSRTWKNPVLWSHYGNKHRGICLGFDVPAESVVPVTYTVARPQLPPNPADLSEAFSRQLRSTKYEGWKYEDEIRVFVGLDPTEEREGGYYYFGFCAHLQVKQVIVGPLCDVDATLNAAIKQHAGEVEILKARLAFRSFEVVKDNRDFWNRQAKKFRQRKL